ncbi:MAG: hypothetical protein GY944_24735 [bacterium]|nr:hypothetical protein [bacterium]
MLLGVAFKVTLLSLLLLALLVPLRVRMLAPEVRALEARDGPYSRHPIVGLLAPLARLLDGIVASSPDGRERSGFAAMLVFVAPLVAFAVVPFGLRYVFSAGAVELVVAHVEWGFVWLVAAAIFSLYAGAALFDDTEQRVRYGIESLSFVVGAGFALAGLAIVFDSIDPLEIALAQDTTLAVGDFFGPALPALQRLRVPAWGVFLQPVSFVLFSVCALAIPHVAVARRAGRTRQAQSGVEIFLVDVAEQTSALLTAAVVVALFFGGGALPFVSTQSVVEVIAPHFGAGAAKILCMGLHLGTFTLKVLIITAALEPVRRRLAALSFERALEGCWHYAVPLGVVNVFITARFLVGIGAPP